MLKKIVVSVIALLVGIFGVVWVTGIGFHTTYTPASVGVSIENPPSAPLHTPQIMVISDDGRPACTRMDRPLSLKFDDDVNPTSLTVGTFVVKRYIPPLQRCAGQDKRTTIIVANRISVPQSWRTNPGTHELKVVVDGKTSLLTFTNDAGNLSLTKVSGDEVRVSSAALIKRDQ